MAETFLASVKSFKSDHTDVVLAFSIPETDQDKAHAVSKLRDQVVSVTVCTIKELRAHEKEAKARR